MKNTNNGLRNTMKDEIIIRPKTLHGFVQGLSGMFVTKDNPGGLTPKELKMLSIMVFICKQKNVKTITREVREGMVEITAHSAQVITNYINKFKKKGAITDDGKISSVLFGNRVTILYEE